MGRKVLSPATKLARQATKAERKRTAKGAQNKLILDRKAYSDEIHRLPICPLPTTAPATHWQKTQLDSSYNLLGNEQSLRKYWTMVSQSKSFLYFSVYTQRTYSYLILLKCRGHGGQSCSAFEWLSNPLDERRLGDLKRLQVLHDQLGKKYGKTSPASPSDSLIMDVLSLEQHPSTPLPTNLPTTPQTEPSEHHVHQDIPLRSPLGRSKRCRSPSSTAVPRKRAMTEGVFSTNAT
jgi:hypothetical protein